MSARKEKQKEYFRNYYQDHKDECIERNIKLIQANRAKRKEYSRNYYTKHKEYFDAKNYHRNHNIAYNISVKEFYKQLNEARLLDLKRHIDCQLDLFEQEYLDFYT